MSYLYGKIVFIQMKLRVKKILKQQKISQRELAKRMDMMPEALSRLLKKGNPTMSTLENIAIALDVSIEELFEDERIEKKISGYLEVGGVIHKINSKKDLDKFYEQFVKK